MTRLRILYLEPFDGGSHAAFTRTLTSGVDADWTRLTLPGRHWKWRVRGAATYWARVHEEELKREVDVVFASSMVPLAELVGLVPSLAATPKVLYFHENQLAYPVRDGLTGERDHHFGFTQLVSALAADACWFNSAYNRDSFLAEGQQLLERMPDFVPPGWTDDIAARAAIMPVPIALPDLDDAEFDDSPHEAGPIILWNHRWEHDKGPDRFFAALRRLDHAGIPFRLVLAGERYDRWPPGFDEARTRYGDRILQFGPLESRSQYEAWLGRAHLAISTAEHEFFGVSMLEATHFGAHPLVPDRLAYPELFPSEHRYADDTALVRELERLIREWSRGATRLRRDRRALTRRFGAPTLTAFRDALEALAERRA